MIKVFCFGRLAQLVERLVYTERVEGSSPPAPTTNELLSVFDSFNFFC